MSGWIRSLAYTGFMVVPASLMIVSAHPWLGAGTFVAVLAATLADSRRRIGAAAAPQRRLLPSARPGPARERIAAGATRFTADGEERPLRDHDEQLIHFPPRRMPL